MKNGNLEIRISRRSRDNWEKRIGIKERIEKITKTGKRHKQT